MAGDDERLSLLLGGDSLLGPRSGIGRMTYEIARVLRGHPEIAEFGLLLRGEVHGSEWLRSLEPGSGPSAAPPPAPPGSGVARLKRLVGDHVPGVTRLHLARRRWRLRAELRRVAPRLRAASRLPLVYHEPNMITRPFDGPTVVTMNDLSWHHEPEMHPRDRLRWIDRNIRRTLDGASRFVAISAFTRDDMVRELGVDPARVDVAHLAPSPAFRPMEAGEAAAALARFDLRDRGYLLSISTIEPRKNFDRLLAAYLALPATLRERTPLAIAGGKGWGRALARPEAERALASGQLRMLGHGPDGDLAALTARAAAFVYVSLYEGFGLPVVEAMAAGTPVVASATTATGEVAGEAAITVDPLDEAAICEGVRRMLEDEAGWAAWRERGLRRAAEFSWERTVDAMARTWRRAAI